MNTVLRLFENGHTNAEQKIIFTHNNLNENNKLKTEQKQQKETVETGMGPKDIMRVYWRDVVEG